MNTCGTEQAALAPTTGRRAATLLLALMPLLLFGGAARALPDEDEEEEAPLEFRAQGAFGSNFYVIESPFERKNVTSFFDQYRFIRDKDDIPPWFVGVFDLDLGLFRDDGTALLQLEWRNPNWLNEQAELDLDWQGLELELEYYRYRSAQLRQYPFGTFQDLPPDQFPPPVVFGRFYTDPFGAPLDPSGRFFARRWGIGGLASLRPEQFGWETGALRQLDLYGRHERRSGFRQRSTLLDAREPASSQSARFRGLEERVDQQVSTASGTLVLTPGGWFTSAVNANFEAFRNDAPVVTLADLAREDPRIPPPATAAQADRAFFFIPDTNRVGGSIQLARRVGAASFEGGGYVTQLSQTGRSAPLQQLEGIGNTSVLTYSIDGSFDWPITKRYGLQGFAKFLQRRNSLDTSAFAKLAPPIGQVDPFLRRRSEFSAGLEFAWRPRAGTQISLGYDLDWVGRDLEFAQGLGTISPQVNLLEGNSQQHTFFVRGRTRLLRALQLQGELGFLWAPETAFPRDFAYSPFVKARGSYLVPRPFPMTLSFSGGFLYGKNDEYSLVGNSPGASQDKDFRETTWDYNLTANAVPTPPLSLFASFSQRHDDQRFAYVRSNVPRYDDPALLGFFLDSTPDYRSNVLSLVLGGRWQATRRLDLSLAPSFTWVRVDFSNPTVTTVDDGAVLPNTTAVLEDVNAIKNRIISLQSDVGYEFVPGLRVELGYRFDHLSAPAPRQPLDLGTNLHSARFAVRLDWSELR